MTIEDTLGNWLPQYPAWKDVTIHRLLDMTSPIPGYDNQPSIGKIMGNDPSHRFTPQKPVAATYPHNGKPKPVSSWTYSNTNYILARLSSKRRAANRTPTSCASCSTKLG